MKAVRVRTDYTVRLPKEIRERVRPGDQMDVRVDGNNVVYIGIAKEEPTLREIIDIIRRNPDPNPPSEEEIEEIIHEVRRSRR